MVTGVVPATELAVTVKLTVLLPAATVTEAGTVADAESLDDKATETPPVGAAALKVIVPIDDAPLATLVGVRETEERATLAAGMTLSAAVLLTLL
jgi:hypothetical protein